MTMVNYIDVSFNVYTFGDMQTNPPNAKKKCLLHSVLSINTLLRKLKAKIYLRSIW